MNFDDKSDRDSRLSFWSMRIKFHCGGIQEFALKENGWFGQVRGYQPAKSTRGTRVADWGRMRLDTKKY